MPHNSPEFESQDIKGRTKQFIGTVGTSAVLVPAVAEGRITEALIICGVDNANSARLQFDFTAQSNYSDGLNKGSYIGWSLKGTPSTGAAIQQIQLKANQAGVTYLVIINFEE
jgi:hypothetical protein